MTLTQIALTISAGFIYTFVCYSVNKHSIKVIINSKTIFGLLFLLSLVSSEFYSFILWFSLGCSVCLYIQLKWVNPYVEFFIDENGNINTERLTDLTTTTALYTMALNGEFDKAKKEFDVERNQIRR